MHRLVCFILFLLIGLEIKLEAQYNNIYRNITIIGNKRTNNTVIYRELGFKNNDSIVFNDSIGNLWKQRITDLGLFTHVAIQTQKDSILVLLKERKFTWILPEFTWADRNFNVWWQGKDLARLIYGGTLYINNIRGLNHTLALQVIHGYNRSYGVHYSKPFANYNHGWAYSLGAGYWSNHELWYKTRQDRLQFLRISSEPVQKNTWFTASVKKRISFYNHFDLQAGFGTYRFSDSALVVDAPDVRRYFAGISGNYASLGFAFISDHRLQRHYPVGGHYLRAGVNYTRINPLKRSPAVVQWSLKALKFQPLGKQWVWAGSFQSGYNQDLNALTEGSLPYVFSRQLGYGSQYVRGYEPYVADGSGFVLGKTALRRPVFRHTGMKIPGIERYKNYQTLPVSVWFSIFADAGRIIQPVVLPENNLNKQWMTGTGLGLDVIFWYTAMSRFEISRNQMGSWVFNITFSNAF